MNLKALSKKLSYILRHNPEDVGLTLDSGGWMDVPPLLLALDVTREALDQVVADNNKKRFAFNEDGQKIRAVQGHSIPVDLGLYPVKPPTVLYHGTAGHMLSLILPEGIKRQTRQFVHLSEYIETAKQVGARHGRPIVLEIATLWMWYEGCKFYQSENGVWLTEYVHPQYIYLNGEPARV